MVLFPHGNERNFPTPEKNVVVVLWHSDDQEEEAAEKNAAAHVASIVRPTGIAVTTMSSSRHTLKPPQIKQLARNYRNINIRILPEGWIIMNFPIRRIW